VEVHVRGVFKGVEAWKWEVVVEVHPLLPCLQEATRLAAEIA